jgi:hypothetical protein
LICESAFDEINVLTPLSDPLLPFLAVPVREKC